jgi:hypothetical protein
MNALRKRIGHGAPGLSAFERGLRVLNRGEDEDAGRAAERPSRVSAEGVSKEGVRIGEEVDDNAQPGRPRGEYRRLGGLSTSTHLS